MTPTSATGISTDGAPVRHRASQRGFTLLEILVVVTIIGIFLSVAMLSTDIVSFERRLEQEAQKLGTRLRFTSEEALMQNRDFGVVFYEEGYEFLMFERGQGWLPAGGAGMEGFALENDMLIELRVEDREVVLEPRCELFACGVQAMLDEDEEDEEQDAENSYETEQESVQPQVVLYSSGEMTPFTIEFIRESEMLDPGYELTVDFDGKTEVAPGDGI